jgi:hypothetical protein
MPADRTTFEIPATLGRSGLFKFDLKGISTQALSDLAVDVVVEVAKVRGVSPVQHMRDMIEAAPPEYH